MTTYAVRVWMPDRPGALGAVASRVGAVRGDLVGIDILERGAGQAIDELIIELPSPDLVSLLVAEINEVDGVDVETIRVLPPGGVPDARLSALETAALLVDQRDVAGLLRTLAVHAQADFEAAWVAVVGGDPLVARATVGTPPPPQWLSAFVAGSASCSGAAVEGPARTGPDDIAWAALGSAPASLVLGRTGRPFRSRERAQLAALAHIAEHRIAELLCRARATHPSAV